jgi:translation elongation factor EF-Tu-like GTPase
MAGPDFGVILTIDVHLLATEDGGRRTAIGRGYRPLCVMRSRDGSETLVGLCELDPANDIAPGDDGEAKLRFLRDVADLVLSLGHPGFQFSLAEGLKVVGVAAVRTVETIPAQKDR